MKKLFSFILITLIATFGIANANAQVPTQDYNITYLENRDSEMSTGSPYSPTIITNSFTTNLIPIENNSIILNSPTNFHFLIFYDSNEEVIGYYLNSSVSDNFWRTYSGINWYGDFTNNTNQTLTVPSGAESFVLMRRNGVAPSYTFSQFSQSTVDYFPQGVPNDISLYTYTGDNYISNEADSEDRDIKFSSDGTKMYLLFQSGNVYQYTLSTPYDITTATYDNVSFNGSLFSVAMAITFNNDGTKLYGIGYSNDRVYQYSLSTAWDLSTATYDNINFFAGTQNLVPSALAFNDIGSKMYVMDLNTDRIYQYSLSTNFNVGTASYDNISFSTLPEESTPAGLEFNSNGTKMYIGGYGTQFIYQYTLSTPYNIGTASYDNISLYTIPSGSDPTTSFRGFTFADNFNSIVILSNENIVKFSSAQYPLSVNVDSNYGDYLDSPITYSDNDESYNTYPISATIDSSSDSFSLSTPNTIGNYTFSHWFNLDTNTVESSNNPLFRGNITENLNLRAIYTGVPNYDIDLNMESGVSGNIEYRTTTVNNNSLGTITINAPIIDEVVPEGIIFQATAPDVVGYTFDGWYDTSDNTLFTTDELLTFQTNPFALSVEITRDWTYEARYTEIPTYTFFANSTLPNPPNFEYEVNAGGTLSAYPVNITVNEGDDVYITAPTTNIGFYEFDGWYNNTTNNLISTNPTLFIYENIQQDISIQARYSLPPEYEVNLTLSSQIGDILFSVDGGAVIQAPTINQTLYEGQTFIAQAPSDDDYRFDGWFDLEIGSGQLYSTNPVIDEQSVSRDYILQARFSQEFTILFSTEGGTPVNPIDAYEGDLVQAPIPPTREGFAFAGWNDSSTPFEIVSFPFVITQDTTFIAQWTPVYTITFNSNGGTQVDSIIVSEGAIATQPNDPTKFGYLFQGWFTDNQTFSNEYTFTQPVNSDIVLHANWEIGSDSDISETLNNWVANSGISSLFIVLVILIAISVSLGIIGSNMFVIIISNLSIIFVFTALGFIPLWIVLVAGLGVIGFIIMNVFGGRNG